MPIKITKSVPPPIPQKRTTEIMIRSTTFDERFITITPATKYGDGKRIITERCVQIKTAGYAPYITLTLGEVERLGNALNFLVLEQMEIQRGQRESI